MLLLEWRKNIYSIQTNYENDVDNNCLNVNALKLSGNIEKKVKIKKKLEIMSQYSWYLRDVRIYNDIVFSKQRKKYI